MNRTELEKYLSKIAKAKPTYPYGPSIAVYSTDDEMFAVSDTSKKNLVLSLRCDKQLATLLKERYEEVMTATRLHKDKWITIVLSGQLTQSEIEGLIDHSYALARVEKR